MLKDLPKKPCSLAPRATLLTIMHTAFQEFQGSSEGGDKEGMLWLEGEGCRDQFHKPAEPERSG